MKKQRIKKALVSSALALILCVSMLVGNTFAWFTDTASTSVNRIQAGTLDVELLMATKWDLDDPDDWTGVGTPTEWKNAEGGTLNFRTVDGRDAKNIYWEPGCEYVLPHIRIVNKGNLALKFKLDITGIGGDAKLNEVIEWVSFWGLIDADGEEQSDWVSVDKIEDGNWLDAEYILLPGEQAELLIYGHMYETAGNEYQGLSIEGAAITVYATQYTYEYDSSTNQYDKDATYPDSWDGTVATQEELEAVTNTIAKTVKIDSPELLAAFAESVNNGNNYFKYTVTLENDIDLGNKEWTPIGTSGNPFQGTFDGGDHTISNLKITSGSNVGLFGHITLANDVKNPRTSISEYNYTPGIKNLTLNNVTIKADGSGAFVGNANTTTQNAGNGGALQLHNLKLTGTVTIEGKDVGGIIGTEWTDFQIHASNITVYVEDGSYVKGTGVIGGVFASTPHGTVENITSNINVFASVNSDGKVAAGGIVGCAGWKLSNVTCTGNVVVTNVAKEANDKYMVGKIVGKEANNPYWNYYKSEYKYGSVFTEFTANNSISITLTDSTVLTQNGLTSSDKKGSLNRVDYSQSLVGAPIWEWKW